MTRIKNSISSGLRFLSKKESGSQQHLFLEIFGIVFSLLFIGMWPLPMNTSILLPKNIMGHSFKREKEILQLQFAGEFFVFNFVVERNTNEKSFYQFLDSLSFVALSCYAYAFGQ